MRRSVATLALTGAIALLVALMVSGCNQSVAVTARKEFEQTYQIDPYGTLSLANFSGSVVIRAHDRPELHVQAVTTAKDIRRLNEISVNIKASDDRAAITTRFPAEKRRLGAIVGKVDYVLQVPRTMKLSRVEVENGSLLIEGIRAPELDASVVDGALSVRECFGNAKLTVAHGSLEVRYDRWEEGLFSVAANIANGDVRLFLPLDASLHLSARAPAGKVVNRLAETVELNGRSTTKVDMAIGEAVRSELNICATTGNVEISSIKTLASD